MHMTTNDELSPCLCCGALTIGEGGVYEICTTCGWEDDPIQQANPEYAGGANVESLNSARTKWRIKNPIN